MLIPEEFRKCSAFLFVKKVDEGTGAHRVDRAATAFFVSVPISDSASIGYMVTARHVIDASRPYGPLFARINLKDGSYRDLDADQEGWTVHPSTDVAVHRVALPPKEYDLLTIPLSMLATDEYAAQNKIGPGDDVFFVGLFSQHPGETRNQPIIRFGNISLMPHEPVPVRLDPSSDVRTPIDAYLVEARSWGGHSGSPAFVYFPPHREPGIARVGGQAPVLLGLVHGHYEIEQDVALIGDILGSGKVPVNAGMAVVVPSQKIIETLMQNELVEERASILEQIQEQAPSPTPDSEPTSSTESDD